jgi:WD40 repeat protein
MLGAALPADLFDSELLTVFSNSFGQSVRFAGTNSDHVVAVGADGKVRVFDLTKTNPLQTMRALVSDKPLLGRTQDASAALVAEVMGGTVRLSDPLTGEAMGNITLPQSFMISNVTVSPAGQALIVNGQDARGDYSVLLYNARTQRLLAKRPYASWLNPAFSPGGDTLALTVFTRGHDEIEFIDASTGRLRFAVPSTGEPGKDPRFLPGIALVGTPTGTKAFRLDTGAPTTLNATFARIAADGCTSCWINVSQRHIAHLNPSSAFTVFDEHGKAIGTFGPGQHRDVVYRHMALSQDGSRAALWDINTGRVQLFDVKTGRELGESFKVSPTFPYGVPSADAETIEFATDSRTVVLHWDSPTPTVATIDVEDFALDNHVCAIAMRDLTTAEWRVAGQTEPVPRICG